MVFCLSVCYLRFVVFGSCVNWLIVGSLEGMEKNLGRERRGMGEWKLERLFGGVFFTGKVREGYFFLITVFFFFGFFFAHFALRWEIGSSSRQSE